MSELDNTSGDGREGQSLTIPRRPPCLESAAWMIPSPTRTQQRNFNINFPGFVSSNF